MNLDTCAGRRPMRMIPALAMMAVACSTPQLGRAAEPDAVPAVAYVADGRSTAEHLSARYQTLATEHGWTMETVFAYPGADGPRIRAWRTARRGEALWILAGVHGEEPAGPNAIAAHLASIVELAASGVPIVVIPLINPKAYRSNWRYPNTPERDWHKGGYSVGDAEYLLPDLEKGTRPRAAAPPGPETQALTQFVLHLAETYPPRLVLDLHEDELSTDGGYIYSQGERATDNPVGAEIIRLLQASGIPIRQSGHTRFGEPVAAGVISRDDQGQPIRDGSIDELLASKEIFKDGKAISGPSASTVIVVETPAFAGSRFDLRVAAHGSVIEHVGELWRLGQAIRY
jgi:predicted deacylase